MTTGLTGLTTTGLVGAVELLDRSLGYTRVVLAGVTAEALDRPTPCRGWSLRTLLAHMDDGLDAFTEAAGGRVALPPVGHDPLRVDRLRAKACALLGLWSTPPDDVDIGRLALPTGLLVGAAALEITVHGWDVGQAVAGGPAVPEDLAARLLPVAHALVTPGDRGMRFAPEVPVEPGATYDERLRAFLGRAP